MTARIQFFSQLDNGKRSFTLRVGTITAKALTQMSTLVDPVVIDTRDGSRVADVERHAYEPGVPYQVLRDAVVAPAPSAWTPVGSLDWLRSGALGRRRVGVHGRDVLVWHDAASGHVGAIDAVCYHFGAPLEAAPIEQVGGHSCLVCPWHRYPIALDTGESFVQPSGESKGVKQRVHECRLDDAGATVLVRLNQAPDSIASDHYATMGLYASSSSSSSSTSAPAPIFSLHSSLPGSSRSATAADDDSVLSGIVTARRSFLEESLFRLSVEWNDKAFVFPLGHHVDVLFDDELPTRSYTPVDSSAGKIELMVRDCGATSHRLAHLAPGSALRVRAPLGRYVAEAAVTRAVFVGNGTGLAPLLAVLRSRSFDCAGLLHAQRQSELWTPAALAPLPPLAWHQCVDRRRRQIDAPLVAQLIAAVEPQRAYVCGTDAFCDAVVELLRTHHPQLTIFQF
jgi:NAD(P)H-flavin reductase/nitrite reductase/ring-hydroxylating ferredoxin subunit